MDDVMLSWQEFTCPTCSQPAGRKCRTLNTGKITDTHAARMNLHAKAHGYYPRWHSVKL